MRNIIILISLVFTLNSCNQQKCEEFDITKMPFNVTDFKNITEYTNGSDTMVLSSSNIFQSKSYNQSWLSNFDFEVGQVCEPKYKIKFSDNENRIEINYEFSYSPSENNSIFLYLDFNSTPFFKKVKLHPYYSKIIFQKNLTSNRTLNPYILKIVRLENFRINSFEFYSGEKWYLIKDGDSVINASQHAKISPKDHPLDNQPNKR